MPRTSTLRLTLLHELQNEPAASVTELATRVGKLRPSVSRSLHLLRAEGLVELEGRVWRVTSSGRQEADRATTRLQESVSRLNGALDAITARVTAPVASAEALRALDSMVAELNALVGQQADLVRRFRESFTYAFPKWDFPRWQDIVRGWMPDNLHEVPDLNSVAAVALEEGLPLSWVPRAEIVAAVIEADGPEARLKIISERRDDILDDCEARLDVIAHEWADQSSEAIRAMRLGLIGPAQSHAANIVDSIVLARFGKRGRSAATGRASEELGEQPLRRAAQYITLLPLVRAQTRWSPHSDKAPPDYFSRHVTAHAVGHVGVFAPHSAMTAVMLATSLTLQFASRETAAGGEPL